MKQISINDAMIILLMSLLIIKISSCDVNCKMCVEDKCIKCLSGFILEDNICGKKEKLMNSSIQVCSTRYCQSCNEIGNCEVCRSGFELINKKCYSTSCEIYGPCKYCSEFDCLKCDSGFQILYGFCEESEEVSNLRMILIISIGGALSIITGIILGLCCLMKNRINANGRTIAATMLKNKHIPSGEYIIVNPEKRAQFHTPNPSSNNMLDVYTINSPTVSYNFYQSQVQKVPDEKDSTSVYANESTITVNSIDSCVICGDKKILSFTHCGCALCPTHTYAMNNQTEILTCPQHQTIITEAFIIKRDKKTKIKGNAIRQLGQTIQICPVCNLSPGTNNFNCGCPILLCSHCFNDNINVFKYKKCPGCGNPYSANEKDCCK